MTLVVIIVVLYMLAMVGIGLYGKKYVHNFDDFLTTGKRATTLMIAGSAIGAQIGSGFVVGGAQNGADMGLGGAWYGIGCGISYIIIGFALTKFVYSKGYVTLSDYFEDRYGGKVTRLIYSIATPIGSIASLAAQIMAGSAIFVALGMDGNIGAIVATIVVLAYSCLSGLWGAQMTSVIQVAIILVSLVLGTFIIFVQGAVDIFATMPASSFQLLPFDSALWVSMVVPSITVAFVDQSIFQRLASGCSEKASCLGHVIGGLVMIPLAFLPVLMGMYGKALYPEAASASVFWLVTLDHMPSIVAALLVAAVLAAVMSTCDCIFLAISATTIHDIYRGMLRPNASDALCSKLAIGINIVAGIFSLLLALKMTNIISVISLAYTFTSSGCLIPFIAGALWKRGTEKGAVVSAVVGIGTALASSSGLIHLPYDILSTLFALAAYIIVSLLDKPRHSLDTSN